MYNIAPRNKLTVQFPFQRSTELAVVSDEKVIYFLKGRKKFRRPLQTRKTPYTSIYEEILSAVFLDILVNKGSELKVTFEYNSTRMLLSNREPREDFHTEVFSNLHCVTIFCNDVMEQFVVTFPWQKLPSRRRQDKRVM